jgi:hypothetical protein
MLVVFALLLLLRRRVSWILPLLLRLLVLLVLSVLLVRMTSTLGVRRAADHAGDEEQCD